jgi:hypothetical protein
MFTQVLGMGIAYGVTNRLTVTADLPLVFARYEPVPGDLGEGAHGIRPHTIDDGFWHSTVTDVRLEGRFNVAERPLAVTPFLAAIIPTHRYDTFGHASPSRDLREVLIGVNLGRQLHPVLPRAYFDLRYGFAFAQTVQNVTPNRSNIDLQVGYFLSRRLSVRAFGAWQKTHEGVELPIAASHPLFFLHDRLQRTHFMRAGGAFTFSARRSWDVYVFTATSISGKNTHAPLVVGVGVSRSFGTGRSLGDLPRSISGESERRRLAAASVDRLAGGRAPVTSGSVR